jgi:hypothetical protein
MPTIRFRVSYCFVGKDFSFTQNTEIFKIRSGTVLFVDTINLISVVIFLDELLFLQLKDSSRASIDLIHSRLVTILGNRGILDRFWSCGGDAQGF